MSRSSPGAGWVQLELTDALLCNEFFREKCLRKFQFIGNLFLPRMAGRIAKIRTNKNFVPHGNLPFCLSFVIFPILMTNTGKRDILMAKVRQK